MKTLFHNFPLLGELLIQGIRVDLSYSAIVILVITAMFSTPLMLGSIKNKVYVAVKAQAEKENNAREITIRLGSSSYVQHNLDNAFLKRVKDTYPQFQIVGNHKHQVLIEGSAGSEIRTLQTLVPNDPRTEFLQIRPLIPDNFGLFDVVISNSMGQLLYGNEEWENLWRADASQFTGKPLKLSLSSTGLPIQGEFKVVARQMTPGLKIYTNTQIGICLEKYSMGLGCSEHPELGLPAIPKYVVHSLPPFVMMHCTVQFLNEQCEPEQQQRIIDRLKAKNYLIKKEPSAVAQITQFKVTLTNVEESETGVKILPTKGKCEDRLYHHLEICPSSAVMPEISLATTLKTDSIQSRTIQLVGISEAAEDWLPGIQEMKNQQGGRGIHFDEVGISKRGIEMIAPYKQGVRLGESVHLQVVETSIPAFVVAYYQCPKTTDCPFYLNAEMVFRLQNVKDGVVALDEQYSPPLFLPINPSVDYYEILFYANQLEEVKGLVRQLRMDFPGYDIDYHSHAIDKVERSDKRLSSLFTLTVALSIFFTIFTVGALAKNNIDRRKRQMAQLFILGYSKSFVSLLLVFEYVLLTIIASVSAAVISSGVFTMARNFLQSTSDVGMKEFNTIIASMSIDQDAFINIFILVVLLTTLVAGYAAYYASKSDPVTLLD
jgi:hypothetical protein